MAKNSFVLYYNYEEQLEDLTDEQVGKLLRALFQYEIHDTLPEFADKELKIAFKFIKVHLDNDREKYVKMCEKQKSNIQKRWNKNNTNDTNVYSGIPKIPVYTKHTDNDNVNDNDTDIDNKKKRVKEKGETSSPAPLGQKQQYTALVEASTLSTKMQEQLLEWLEYKKWKYTEMGIKSLLTTVSKNVDKYGESAVCAVIVESMGNMWQGICWDKLGRKGIQEQKEEAEYRVDGEYLVFKNGNRVLRANWEAWGRKDN